MALNGSGIRDTARVLKISPTTVIAELQRRRSAVCTTVYLALLNTGEGEDETMAAPRVHILLIEDNPLHVRLIETLWWRTVSG